MFRHLSVTLVILFNSFLWISEPTFANTEACINKVLQKQELSRHGFQSATQIAEVEHDGIDYHWINLSYPKRNSSDAFISSVFATNKQGLCKLVFIDIPGPLPNLQDYYEVLGREVTDKFIQAFQNQ